MIGTRRPGLFSERGLDLVGSLFEQLLGAAERDADVALALRTEDRTRREEDVGLLHHLIRGLEVTFLPKKLFQVLIHIRKIAILHWKCKETIKFSLYEPMFIYF